MSATVPVGPRAFALLCVGDSMTKAGDPRSIPDGSSVIVDPDRKWKEGDIVVVSKRGTDVVVVKQIRRAVPVRGTISDRGVLPDASVLEEQGGPYFMLTSLNDRYQPIVLSDEMTVLGVVVQTIIDEEERS
jgi:SOS-response transcriptional repressor LexA